MSLQHKIPRQPGIYGIINQLTQKFYIGQTTNLYNAYKNHACAFENNGNPGNRSLVKDVIKYGKENFVFQVFEIIPSEEIVDNQYLNDLKDIYLTCVDFGVYNHSHRKRLKAKGIHFTFDQETGLYSWSRNPETENTKKVNPDQIPSQLVEKQKN
ncbi:GIY-YIG nuclease family protein [Planktothrix agardhii]|uniref:GIY-YIG nuclease family protein n=1 Tax=Planktothrix agardhii TaxID=1160 RepID=UPI0003FFF61F|nr:GIY-YIG nuclease family protein [Planktothrix agardhii]